MWIRYISDANESSIPETFGASDGAIDNHNNEVSILQMKINSLEAENKKLISLLQDVVDLEQGIMNVKLETEIREILKETS